MRTTVQRFCYRWNDPENSDNSDNPDDDANGVNDPADIYATTVDTATADTALNGGILNFLLHFYLSPGPPPATWEFPRGHRDDDNDAGDDDNDGASEDEGDDVDDGDGCLPASR